MEGAIRFEDASIIATIRAGNVDAFAFNITAKLKYT